MFKHTSRCIYMLERHTCHQCSVTKPIPIQEVMIFKKFSSLYFVWAISAHTQKGHIRWPTAPLWLLPVGPPNALEKERLHLELALLRLCSPYYVNLAFQSCKYSIQKCHKFIFPIGRVIPVILNISWCTHTPPRYLLLLSNKKASTLSEFLVSQNNPMQPL